MRRRPARPAALVALLAAGVLLTAACSSGPAPSAVPQAGAPAGGAAAPPSPPVDSRVLAPARQLFRVSVPTRFVDVPPDTPESSAVAPLNQALKAGVGVLAVDRQSGQAAGSGYSPTAGGLCTRTPSQDLAQLGEELRAGAERTGTATGPIRVEQLPALGDAASPRVVVSYPANFNGRVLEVLQVAGLAGPGRACVMTFSTDDAQRDATAVTTVRDTFRMAG